MQSIYGPPPEKRRRGPGLVRKTLRVLGLVVLGLAVFVALVWLEGPAEDPVDLDRLIRIPAMPMPAFDYKFDASAFRPLQTADIIPSSAIHPAETKPQKLRSATTASRPLKSAGIISR